MRQIKQACYWVIVILISLYLLMFLINYSDEKPSALSLIFTKNLQEMANVPSENNAFIASLGFDKHTNEPLVIAGQTRLDYLMSSSPSPSQHLPVSKSDNIDKQFNKLSEQCTQNNPKTCLQIISKNSQQLDLWLDTWQPNFQQYITLVQLPYWHEPAKVSEKLYEAMQSQINSMRSGQRLLLMTVYKKLSDQEFSQAQQLLEFDFSFWRNVLSSSHILLQKNAAISSLNRHINWVNAIVKHQQNVSDVTQFQAPNAWKAPLTTAEKGFDRVLMGEWQFAVLSIERYFAQSNSNHDDKDWFTWLLQPFYQAQSSKNMLANIIDKQLSVSLVQDKADSATANNACKNNTAVVSPSLSYNPIGKLLTCNTSIDITPYIAKLRKLGTKILSLQDL